MGDKVGILSLNKYVGVVNYGSTLQAYALSEKIAQLGYDVEVLDYESKQRKGLNMKYPLFKRTSPYLHTLYFLNFFANLRRYRDQRRFFSEKVRMSKSRYDTYHLETDDYGVFVIGSDTVWNLPQMNGFEPGFYAAFPCMKKAIAYAPSFGECSYSDKEQKQFQDYLKKFIALSVREPVNMESFGERRDEVRTVLDPTLLHTAEFYGKLVKKANRKRRYVLMYTVYGKENTITQKVDAYARRHDLDVVEVGLYKENAHPRIARFLSWFCHKIGQEHMSKILTTSREAVPHDVRFGATLGEWLGLIRDAELVVTNSFHGTALSVVFQKNFFNFSRRDASFKQKFLCELLGVSNRNLKEGVEIVDEPIDYANVVNPRLEELRRQSIAYLSESLKKSGCTTKGK